MQEAYLQTLIEALPTGTCSFCNEIDVPGITIEELSERVEAAFEAHFERTPSEPDAFEFALHRDAEIDFDWCRQGYPVLDVIRDIVQCDEGVAGEVLEILRDKHYIYEPGDADDGECEFSGDSYYDEKETSTAEWEERWHRLEHNLKHESRLFNNDVLELFHSVFAGLDKAKTFSSGLAIVPAGPGYELSELYRAREFQSADSLKEALQSPVEALGPPPGRSARANRMNSTGISVFYGAKEPGSALAEVRPVVGSNVVVAKFKILREVHLLDIHALKGLGCFGSVFDPSYAAELERHGFLRTLSRRLVLPVMPNEQDHAYLITQAVADYLASLQSPTVDGIIFPSVQDGVGVNVVLFHKASLVERLDFPPATTFKAQIEEYDHETGDSYPYYALQVDQPDVNQDMSLEFSLLEDWDLSQGYARSRQPTLSLELESIKVHSIKAVEVKADVSNVTVQYGSLSRQASSFNFDDF